MIVAAVDESADATGRLFSLTAVVMDAAEMTRLVGRLEPYATSNDRGRTEIHTAEQSALDRGTVARIIDQDRHVRAVVTVRAAIEPGAAEAARQTCLGDLLVRLHELDVNSVTLDTRDDPRASDQQRRQHQSRDRNDIRTLRELRGEGKIPAHAEFMVQHRASDVHKPLWVADALAWRIRRSLQYDQPADLAGLSGKLQIIEARGQTRDATAPQTTFVNHLQRLQVAAAKIAERDGIRQPREGVDLAARLQELDQRIASLEDRGAPARHYYTEQQRNPEPPQRGIGR